MISAFLSPGTQIEIFNATLESTNSWPTIKIIEAVARNIRRTLSPNRKLAGFAKHFLSSRSTTRREFDKRRPNTTSDPHNVSFLSSDVVEKKNKIADVYKSKMIALNQWTTSTRERGCKNFLRTYNASPLLIQR